MHGLYALLSMPVSCLMLPTSVLVECVQSSTLNTPALLLLLLLLAADNPQVQRHLTFFHGVVPLHLDFSSSAGEPHQLEGSCLGCHPVSPSDITEALFAGSNASTSSPGCVS
jgi:hypothetical protein